MLRVGKNGKKIVHVLHEIDPYVRSYHKIITNKDVLFTVIYL